MRRAAVAACGLAAAAAMLVPGTGRASGLPPIKHIWIVVLENKGYDDSFTNNVGSYLVALTHKGALLPNYYAVAHQSLPNYIAMIGGQGPTPQTQADCQSYADVQPGTQASGNGHQAQGDGCVYPAAYPTVVDQLGSAGLTWKGYMEDLGLKAGRDDPVTCKDPAATPAKDPTQSADAQDQYAARHDPFMYYRSVIDSPACASNVVTLQSSDHGLLHDLASVDTTPNYSFVSPNLCNDGHDGGGSSTSPTCTGKDVAGDNTGGLVSIDHWLQAYVPPILDSPAYRKDGMLVITFDEADTTKDQSNSANSCCSEPTAADGQPAGGYGLGGGRVGAIVLSPFVAPNTKPDTSYNHYSLLRTVEDVFHTSGGDDQPAAQGHLGWAADYFSGYKMTPFGDDVFTNPGYVPPPVTRQSSGIPTPGHVTLRSPAPSAAPATSPPDNSGSSPGSVIASPGTQPSPGSSGGGTPPPSAAVAATSWAPHFLSAAGAGSGGFLYLLVLIPLLAVGVAAAFLARRRSGGTA